MAGGSEALSVAFEGPLHGWMQVTLQAPSGTFSEAISNVPHEGWVSDLVVGLTELLRQPMGFAVCWNTEPVEYELRLDPTDGENVVLTVSKFLVTTRWSREKECVFAATAPRREMCLAFCRALRKLESSLSPADIVQHWPGFPTKELAALTEQIRASKP